MGTEACGLDDVFSSDGLWFGFRMLSVICSVVCKYRSFLHSFNNLHLILNFYSFITSSYVLSETASVAINGGLYKYCLYGLRAHFDYFLTSSVVDIQLQPWLVQYRSLSWFDTL